MRDLIWAYLASHSRRENRSVNGRGHQFLIFCTCGLCTEACAKLHIKEPELEVVHDSDPPEVVSETDENAEA